MGDEAPGYRGRSEPPLTEAGAHALFELQAREVPDDVAVSDGRSTLTYAELDDRATLGAAALAGHGVAQGDVVAMRIDRSIDAVVALLAIAKAGAAYLPIDPGFPEERVRFVAADAGARWEVTGGSEAEGLPGLTAVPAASLGAAGGAASPPSPRSVSAEDPVYVMYTSGSTGRPKGVEVPHRGVTRLVTDGFYVDMGRADRVLQLAPLAFDASTLEIWGALCRGSRLELAPDGPLSLGEIAALIRARKITVMWLTAGLFHQLAEFELTALCGLRRLFVGGDVVSPHYVARVLEACDGIEIVNGYGPTENTTFTCCHLIRSEADFDPTTVPIGRPLAGTQVFVLDDEMEAVPAGEVGELWTGGAGLARGYVNRDELTHERFVVPETGPAAGVRVYKTGDLVRSRPDGALEFLGRRDLQVKVRGHRVELGEVETLLVEHPAIRQVAVVPEEEALGGKRLVAYVVADLAEDDLTKELRRYLARRAPAFMVPSRFVTVAALPLTPNGKVDRGRLSAAAGRRSN